jgi:hypothetical protein
MYAGSCAIRREWAWGCVRARPAGRVQSRPLLRHGLLILLTLRPLALYPFLELVRGARQIHHSPPPNSARSQRSALMAACRLATRINHRLLPDLPAAGRRGRRTFLGEHEHWRTLFGGCSREHGEHPPLGDVRLFAILFASGVVIWAVPLPRHACPKPL